MDNQKEDIKYTLSKKGAITFILSKFSFILFAVIIAGTFFYIISFQHGIQDLNKMAKTSEGISNVIEMVSASPYDVSIIYETELNGNISFENQSFVIENENVLRKGLLFPIEGENSGKNISVSCLNISKINNKVVIVECH